MILKTLVIGGYGNFGARICRALARDPSIQLLVGGRDLERSRAFAHALQSDAQGVLIDITQDDLAQTFRNHAVGLVIHTAGPFQGQDYVVARAAALADAHYIDLADGRRFVFDFQRTMQSVFLAAGRTGITGASTVPALSSAVINHLCHQWQRIDVIDTCIAPAQTAPRGKATLAAVLGYCGANIDVWEAGQWQTQLGWSNPQNVYFARLRPRLGALCDIPDLELFPQHYCVTTRVMFRAALEVRFAQRTFATLAALYSLGLIKNPARLANALHQTAKMFDFLGSSLGGMVVRVQGLDAQGRVAKAAWHIAADHDHGPEIPCMAAILLARRLAKGQSLRVGAYPCVGLLELAEFEPEFASWGMVTDVE